MKNKKITKVLLSIIIACILISPNTVSAKDDCKASTGCKNCNNTSAETACKNSSAYKEYVKKNKKTSSSGNCKASTGCKNCGNTSAEIACKKSSTYKEYSKHQETTNLEFCAKTAVIWQIVGWVVLIVKIVIPMLLIILGVVDFSKAAISGKDDETKKSLTSLMWRAVSAVVIFFIPTLVTLVMGLVANFKDSGAQADFEVCKTCILNPSSCDTSKDAGKN